jgi:hypothetical protein
MFDGSTSNSDAERETLPGDADAKHVPLVG